MRNAILIVAAIALTSAAVEARPLTTSERSLVEKAVLSKLKDPESARFEWSHYDEKLLAACGKVNSKNSYGGYTGFTAVSVGMLVVKDKPLIAGVIFQDGATLPAGCK